MFPSSNFRKRWFQPLRYRISNGCWKVFLFLKKWDLPTLASCNCNLAMYQNLLHHSSSDNLHVLWMNAHLPPIHNTLIDIKFQRLFDSFPVLCVSQIEVITQKQWFSPLNMANIGCFFFFFGCSRLSWRSGKPQKWRPSQAAALTVPEPDSAVQRIKPLAKSIKSPAKMPRNTKSHWKSCHCGKTWL